MYIYSTSRPSPCLHRSMRFWGVLLGCNSSHPSFLRLSHMRSSTQLLSPVHDVHVILCVSHSSYVVFYVTYIHIYLHTARLHTESLARGSRARYMPHVFVFVYIYIYILFYVNYIYTCVVAWRDGCSFVAWRESLLCRLCCCMS